MHLHNDHVVHSDNKTERLVFLLHGYGSNGEDLLDVARFWAPSVPLTTFIAPNALEPLLENPFGYQWFGLSNLEKDTIQRGIQHARPYLKGFIEENMRHYKVDASKIALMGFSQGAMMALDAALHMPNIGGVLGYSGGFYGSEITLHKKAHNALEKDTKVGGDKAKANSALLSLPLIFLAHGQADAVVPFETYTRSKRELEALGAVVETYTSPHLGHSIDVEGLHRGMQFLQRTLGASAPVIPIPHKKTGDV